MPRIEGSCRRLVGSAWPKLLGLAALLCCVGAGCISGSGGRLPTGKPVSLDGIPATVMSPEERASLPRGVTVQECRDGQLYRFAFPDGSVTYRTLEGDFAGMGSLPSSTR